MGGRATAGSLAFNQSNVPGARAFRRLLRSELDALPFAEQLEYRRPHGAAVEEVFDPALVANKAEAFVDEQACDGAGRHSRVPPMTKAWDNPQALPDRRERTPTDASGTGSDPCAPARKLGHGRGEGGAARRRPRRI